MDNEVKEILEPTKSTVGIRFELPKRIHKRAMSVHANNPRTWTFKDTMIEIVEEGIAAINAKKSS